MHSFAYESAFELSTRKKYVVTALCEHITHKDKDVFISQNMLHYLIEYFKFFTYKNARSKKVKILVGQRFRFKNFIRE